MARSRKRKKKRPLDAIPQPTTWDMLHQSLQQQIDQAEGEENPTATVYKQWYRGVSYRFSLY